MKESGDVKEEKSRPATPTGFIVNGVATRGGALSAKKTKRQRQSDDNLLSPNNTTLRFTSLVPIAKTRPRQARWSE